MARPTIATAPATIKPSRFGLAPEHEAWLKQEFGEQPSIHDLDRVERAGGLTATQKRILDAVRRSVVGNLRATAGVAFNKDGKVEPGTQRIWTLRTAKVPTGHLSKAAAFEAEMKPFLIGQVGALKDFKRFLDAYNPLVKNTPPMMVIGGEEGHGKSEALDGLAKALFGEAATVFTVDLSKVTDDMHDALFSAGGKKGDLSVPRLMEIEDNKLGIVHLTGLDQLKARAPQIADTLLNRLGCRADDKDHAWVPFVLDFDSAPDTKLAPILEDALGKAAVLLRKAQSSFQYLDADAMAEYLEIALPQLLQRPGLGQLHLEWDDEAKAAFAEVLATRLTPIDQLQPRLENLILGPVSAEMVPADALLRVHLLAEYADHPDKLAAAIKELQDPALDLLEAPQIFTVTEEGRVADPALVEGLIENSEQVLEALLQCSQHHDLEVRRLFPEYDRLERLDQVMGEMATALRTRARQKGKLIFEPAPHERLGGLVAECEKLVAQLGRMTAERQAQLDVSMPAHVVVALQSVLEGVRLIAQASDLLRGEAPTPDGTRAHAAQLNRAIEALTNARGLLPIGNLGKNRITHQLQALAAKWIEAVAVARRSQQEGMFPLVLETDAQDLIDEARKLRGQLPVKPLAKGERETNVRRLFESSPEAKKELKDLDRLVKMTIEVAENLGGLSDAQRKTVADLAKEESADSLSARRKIAKELITCENGATDVDERLVRAELIKLPKAALERLKKTEVKVYVVRGKITDFLKQLPKGARPPGYPEGKTFDDVPAIFVPKEAEGNDKGDIVVIVTKEVNGNVILPGLDVKRGYNQVIHECLHGLDVQNYYSTKEEFVSAREAELGVLSQYEKQAKEGNFDRGAAETWAITGERLYGGDESVRKERPLLVKVVEDAFGTGAFA
ncbi:MAG: hypothetical protein IPG45_01840 [Deltaproteobacteria bacterium]|nr:hypothetical protein [Deltaproteobacteria bacterium]